MFPALVAFLGSGPVRAWLSPGLSPSQKRTRVSPDIASLAARTRPLARRSVDDIHEVLRVWDGATEGQTRVDALMRLMGKVSAQLEQ
jgi:hypothetical protein